LEFIHVGLLLRERRQLEVGLSRARFLGLDLRYEGAQPDSFFVEGFQKVLPDHWRVMEHHDSAHLEWSKVLREWLHKVGAVGSFRKIRSRWPRSR